jgi:hypothetical protein
MKQSFKIFVTLFAASSIAFLTSCNKETVSETESVTPKTITTEVTESNRPDGSLETRMASGSQWVLSNTAAGVTQIYQTNFTVANPQNMCVVNAIINVTGVPGVIGSIQLRNAIGLAVGVNNIVYVTTGTASGLASNSLFRLNLNNGTGIFVARTRTAANVNVSISDIEAFDFTSPTAKGLIGNSIQTLNLLTGIVTPSCVLPAGVYQGLTFTSPTTVAVFLPNHISGATFGGYRTVNTITCVASGIINWGAANPNFAQGENGFTNTPTGLRLGNNPVGAAVPNMSRSFANIGTVRNCANLALTVPVFDFASF